MPLIPRQLMLILSIAVPVYAMMGCSRSEPAGSTLKQNLGHGWKVLEFEIDGQKRKFLYHGAGIGDNEVECITELKD